MSEPAHYCETNAGSVETCPACWTVTFNASEARVIHLAGELAQARIDRDTARDRAEASEAKVTAALATYAHDPRCAIRRVLRPVCDCWRAALIDPPKAEPGKCPECNPTSPYKHEQSCMRFGDLS